MTVGLGCVFLSLGLIETAYETRAWLHLSALGLIETAYGSRAWLRLSAFRPD